MPEGSITVNLGDLENALSGVTDLLGTSAEEGEPQGIAGAASLLSSSPDELFDSFGGELTDQLSNVFSAAANTDLTAVTDTLSSVQDAVDIIPTDALSNISTQISSLDSVVSSDLVNQLRDIVNLIRSISESVPEDRSAIAQALVDQILNVLSEIGGDEATVVNTWIASVQEMFKEIMPVIEQVNNGANADEALISIFQKALDGVLKIMGFPAIQKTINFLDTYPPKANIEASLSGIDGLMLSIEAEFDNVTLAANGSYIDFRDAIMNVSNQIDDVYYKIRPLNIAIRKVSESRIFQPNALENYLREKMDQALGVKVTNTQNINDPFHALFDKLDEAIDGIDLSFVSDEVLGFFNDLQSQIEEVDLPSIGDVVEEQLQPVSQAVDGLQSGVTSFLGEIEGFSDDLVAQLQASLGSIGEFAEDGSFRYHFQNDLDSVFQQARLAISGDPENPSAPSVAGAVDDFKQMIVDLLAQLNTVLSEVQGLIGGVTSTAVAGVESFETYITDLDIPALVEALRVKVEEILNEIAPIEFGVIVDPIIAELDENTTKLQGVDTSDLNDMLKEALKLALDVVMSIDFTQEIRTPLSEQLQNIKAVPKNAIDSLQDKYEEAIQKLDTLSPAVLLNDLLSFFDVIQEALDNVSIENLLQPLDELHLEYLQQPYSQLAPSVLLKPVTDKFDEFTSLFDDVSGSALIDPVSGQLDIVKDKINDFDMTFWIDDIIAAIEKVKTDLEAIRPSTALQPLVDEFAKIEAELDKFKPSIVFAPVVELAAPLQAYFENIQQTAITALHDIFQVPLEVFEKLKPEELMQTIRQHIDDILNILKQVNLPARYNALKGKYYDFNLSVSALDNNAYLSVSAHINPDLRLGPVIADYNRLISMLESIKQNLDLSSLDDLYLELQERVTGLLPPFAQALLDEETFKRLMGLANPARFLDELDERFDTIIDKLLPIRPEDITAELDETYDAVLALVDNLDLIDALNAVKDQFNDIKAIADSIRVDFLADDLDRVINSVKALIEALDPANAIGELDTLHGELGDVIEQTKPSLLLQDLDTTLEQVKSIVTALDMRQTLAEPIEDAWQAVVDALAEVDFTIVLQPLVDKLDEVENEFFDGLQRTENSFDTMLGAAKTALSGNGSGASASVGI